MASSPGIQSSLSQYEQLVKKQLSFTEDEDNSNGTPQSGGDGQGDADGGGVFDKPLTEEQQMSMRAVQNTLEKLDSKHGVLQRHASAECVRDEVDDNDYLKRTMSDSIRRSDSATKMDERASAEPRNDSTIITSSEPSRSRQDSIRSDSEPRTSAPTRIPQLDPTRPRVQPELSQPQVKTPLTTKRTVPLTTSTPKTLGQECRPLKASDILKDSLQDSPDKAPSMRQLLVESKAETSELRRQIEELVTENNKLKSGTGSSLTNGHRSSADSVSHIHGKLSESERRCDNLLREKENMATELWKLRHQVEELINSKSEVGSDTGDGASSTHKSAAGRSAEAAESTERRIVDLESQIQDLQEANETSSAEVLRLDQENQMLTAHIKRLTSNIEQDSEVERERLHQQISELRKHHNRHSDDEVLHLRSEIAQLRVDLKAMQDKTNILQEENVKLRENLREAKTANKWKGGSSNVNDNIGNDRHDIRQSKDAAWEEISTLKHKILEFSTRNPVTSLSNKTPSLDKRAVHISTGTSTRLGMSSFDRPTVKPSYATNDSLGLGSAHNPPNQRKDNFRPAYQPSIQSSDDRPPSPSGRSDISESTTVLMAGFEAYKPLSRSANLLRFSPPSRKIEDDRVSECTMDILNEAAFNTQAYAAYDVNDDVKNSHGYNSTASHLRRGSVGSSSIHSESTQERLAPPATYGLRSVLVPVLPTQHNKTPGTVPTRTALNTAGRRPFAPRTPGDLTIGDIAKFTKPDGRICRGLVKFVGHLHDKNETYVGLELEYQDGKHDGMYEGVRYFDCKPNRGAFITFNKVIMVWGS